MAHITKAEIETRVESIRSAGQRIADQQDRMLTKDDFEPLIRPDDVVEGRDLSGITVRATQYFDDDHRAVYFDLGDVDLSDHNLTRSHWGHVEMGQAQRADLSNAKFDHLRFEGDAGQALLIGTHIDALYVENNANLRDAVAIGLETRHWGEMQRKVVGVAITTADELEKRIDRFEPEQLERMKEAFEEAKRQAQQRITRLPQVREYDTSYESGRKRNDLMKETNKIAEYDKALAVVARALEPDGQGHAEDAEIRSPAQHRQMRP